MKSDKHLVVLSGAGISAESGISTFRDSNGLWENYRIEDVATPEGFARNPQTVLDFYNARHNELKNVQPNYGHIGLAELEEFLKVTIITQNVDDLHERAGSTNIIHLHGELTKARSVRNEENIVDWPQDVNLHIGDKGSDGQQLRPHIVWFGEAVPNMEYAIDYVQKADIMLIIGTSMNVYPAAGLINYLKRDCKIYLIDPKEVTIPGFNINVIKKGASEGMKDFVKEIKDNL